MARREIIVVRTGTANLASMCAGLRRVGYATRLSENPDEVRRAAAVVLPGVGAFGSAMERLQRTKLVGVLKDRIESGRPTLAVCLGMQVLFETSEESPGFVGLTAVRGRITRLPTTVRVPQLGWNYVEGDPACRIIRSGYAYFANSYKLAAPPDGWNAAYTEHGGRWVAAMERGAVCACQFHPELSGEWGLALLRRWTACAVAPSGGVPC